MSNDSIIVRVFKLWAKIAMMIVDGTRDPTNVADTLQTILNPTTLKPIEISPVKLPGVGLKSVEKDADQRSFQLTAVDLSNVSFEACLTHGESFISGKEKLERLIAMGGVRLDPRFGFALFLEKGQKTLELIYQKHGVTYVDFFGQIFEDEAGSRYVHKLSRVRVGEWRWGVTRLGCKWGMGSYSACVKS